MSNIKRPEIPDFRTPGSISFEAYGFTIECSKPYTGKTTHFMAGGESGELRWSFVDEERWHHTVSIQASRKVSLGGDMEWHVTDHDWIPTMEKVVALAFALSIQKEHEQTTKP